MRAHYRNVIQDTAGNISVGASVALYQPGTQTPIAATIFADGSSGTTMTNPFTSANGVVSFYLAEAQRLDIWVTPVGGSAISFLDIDVNAPDMFGGVAVFSGTGAQTVFNINHGLPAAPSTYSVDAGSVAAAAAFYVTATSTQLVVTFIAAPANGSNNVSLAWMAKV